MTPDQVHCFLNAAVQMNPRCSARLKRQSQTLERCVRAQHQRVQTLRTLYATEHQQRTEHEATIAVLHQQRTEHEATIAVLRRTLVALTSESDDVRTACKRQRTLDGWTTSMDAPVPPPVPRPVSRNVQERSDGIHSPSAQTGPPL